MGLEAIKTDVTALSSSRKSVSGVQHYYPAGQIPSNRALLWFPFDAEDLSSKRSGMDGEVGTNASSDPEEILVPVCWGETMP